MEVVLWKQAFVVCLCNKPTYFCSKISRSHKELPTIKPPLPKWFFTNSSNEKKCKKKLENLLPSPNQIDNQYNGVEREKSTSHHAKTMADLSEPKNIFKRFESALIIEKKPQNRHASGLSPKRPLKVHVVYSTTNGGKGTEPNKYLITKDLIFRTLYQSNMERI